MIAKEAIQAKFEKIGATVARILTKQAKAGVKAKDRNRRKNDAYIRQGEWFFIPAPQFDQGACVIHKNEPIQRGRSSPTFARN